MLQKLYKAPYIGLIGLVVGFLTQPLGHTGYTLIKELAGDYKFVVAGVVGIIGMVLLAKALNRDENSGTWMGMLAGWLIWIGFFEFSFVFFAELYQVPPYVVEEGGYAAGGSANILQASLTTMLALFVVYGLFNRQTKCNLIRWLHRNTGMNPGMPTPENGRSFARITAMEVLFVTWFCYLFWLYMIYFGLSGSGMTIIMSVYALWAIWSFYLVYRASLQVRAPSALRYGVGAGIVLWGTAEMPAHFGAYSEVWLKPFEFPIFNAAVFTVFVAGLVFIAKRPLPSRRTQVASSNA